MEEFLNKLSPSAFDFYVDEMMSDATVPIQFKNDNFNSEVIELSFSIRQYLWFFFFLKKFIYNNLIVIMGEEGFEHWMSLLEIVGDAN